MRAKIAQRAKGHVFEDRFMKLNSLQLMVAYRQAIKEEKEEVERLGEIYQAGFKRLEENFKELRIYTNPKLWMDLENEKKLQVMRDDVNVDNFDETWNEMMEFIPKTVTVEENVPSLENSKLPKLDKKTQELITGFLPKRKVKPKEGG